MSDEVVGRPRGYLATGRAMSFGEQADLYERVRPGYPEALAAALGARPGLRLLDVGCGTGKASAAFRAAGCDVLGIDPDPRMAELGRERGLEVEVGRFEEWETAGRRFDLVIAGQAWHWVEPRIGPTKASRLLERGGRLAPFWNYRHPAGPLQSRLEPLYARLAPALLEHSPLLGTVDDIEELNRYAEAITLSGVFEVAEILRFPWTTSYTTEEWAGLSRTQSDHRLLAPEALEELLAAVGEELAHGGPWVVDYESAVVIATRR
ncbi:MAG TPA: class I SAM-dependent methyltransferase [Acidimicrobiales bacterium]|nr:class I SAM-dependent methyltransferase [Acidimicrobiales bacterium]